MTSALVAVDAAGSKLLRESVHIEHPSEPYPRGRGGAEPAGVGADSA